ncbi:MAG: hypothetical protein MZV64_67835 [Ignavibacteriales bacterium]|nr:hypothetical protein [Ignavibacteriales bacterium]
MDVYGARDFSARDAQFARALKHLRWMPPPPARWRRSPTRSSCRPDGRAGQCGCGAPGFGRDPAVGGEPPLTVAGYAQALSRRVRRRATTTDRPRRRDRPPAAVVHFPGIEYALRLAATPARLAAMATCSPSVAASRPPCSARRRASSSRRSVSRRRQRRLLAGPPDGLPAAAESAAAELSP